MAKSNTNFSLFSRKALLGTTIGAALFFMIVGVIFWGGFNTAMEVTNTTNFCIACHEMKDNVYKEYVETVHYTNSSGVRAECADCHVPKTWVHKVVRKVQASNEVLHMLLGSIDTPEKFDAKRLKLASNVWRTMKATNSRECRNCHDFKTMNPENQKPRARKQHLNAMLKGNTCIDCHKGIAHTKVHDQLSEEDMDELMLPDPLLIEPLPPQWQAFVDNGGKVVASRSDHDKTNQSDDAPTTTATAAPVAKVATATATAAPASSGAVDDWAKVPSRKVVFFYPGQSSMEWVMRGRDHGGARPVKAGDRCFDCHDEEAVDIGQLIVSGEKLESNPIPGKRGSIPVTISATHDGSHLYMRFVWPESKHAPVPGVKGGKMDPKNPIKLAFMLATDDVQYAGQAGCWGTCHIDAKSMPLEPEGKKVTKYITESRTEIEIKGKNGKKQGGWDKRKSQAEIDAEFKAGHFMDLVRYSSGTGTVDDGYILADRVMKGGQGATFTSHKKNGQWVIDMKRKLKSNKAGDVSMALDQVYNIGFAIHDDYSDTRYHHVSLGYKLGFDNDEAEINAIKK